MITIRVFVLLLAVICFLLAARPPASPSLRWEWLGAALVVASWLV